MVHYAGHAEFDESHPEHSGIRCYGSQVLSGADLAGLGNLPALVFFNACESGRVRGGAFVLGLAAGLRIDLLAFAGVGGAAPGRRRAFALALGAGVGYQLATKVQMTQMPELVAIMHSLVGLAAVFVGFNADIMINTNGNGRARKEPELFAQIVEAGVTDLMFSVDACDPETYRRTLANALADRPDFVSLDLIMPRKSGHRLLFELKRDKELSRIPVLVVTAHAKDELGKGDLDPVALAVLLRRLLERNAPDIIVPGGLVQTSISALFATDLPGDGTLGLAFTPERLRRPICPGDELVVTLEITRLLRGGIVDLDVIVDDGEGRRVTRGSVMPATIDTANASMARPTAITSHIKSAVQTSEAATTTTTKRENGARRTPAAR